MSSESVLPLRSFVSLVRGTTYKGDLVGQPGPVLLGLASIQPDGGFRRGSFKTYGGESPAKITLGPGDVYVSLKDVTQSGDLLGSVSRVPRDIAAGRLTQDTVKLQFDGKPISQEYVYWLLRTPAYRTYCRSHATGTTTLGLARDDFLGFPVVEPSEEDLSLVVLLEALDDRIALLRETNATLEAIAQALFKSWFVDFDPVRAKCQGLAPAGMDEATAALFPEGFEESALGLTPSGWRVAALGDFFELTKGCSYKGEGLSESEGAHMFNLGCFNAHRVFASERIKRYTGEYRPRHSVVGGDLIVANTDMTQARDILGRPAFVPHGFEPCFISHHVFKVVVKATETEVAAALRAFLFFALQQDAFRRRAAGFATGTTVLALPAAAVAECPAIIPPDALLLEFSRAVLPLLQRIRTNELQAGTLGQLRDTLLPRLISGRLRLPEAEAVVSEVPL
jgi:type I restriction enzyme S subunit